jgi:O-acetyl-ADP-ribose deacetylase (regulator of RNase III)
MKECAEIMLHEASEHLRNGSSLETIYFVLFDEEATGIFERTWKRLQA